MMLFFRSFFACYCASGLSHLFTQTAVTKKGKETDVGKPHNIVYIKT